MMAKSKLKFKIKWAALGAALLCSAFGASGLTIDRALGGIVLGKPLDLTVKVLLSPDEELSGLCANVDVMFGETMQEPSRITVTTETGAAANSLNLRVRSISNVDEPVVVLEVRAGCKQTVSRRLVLLSDLSADLSPTVMPSTAVKQALVQPVVVSVPLVTALNVTTAQTAAEPGSGKPAKPSLPPPVVRIKPKVAVVAFSSLLGSSPDLRPRLKLAPIDLSQDWDPMLKATFEMLTPPADDLNKRREAAAYWHLLNLSPKEALRLTAQEDELKQLKLMMAKSQQQMQELNQQLQNAEEQRFSNPLVYALIGLLVALLGGAAFIYHRLGGKGMKDVQWWKASHQSAEFKSVDLNSLDDNHDALPGAVVPASQSPATNSGTTRDTGTAKPRKPTAVPVQTDVSHTEVSISQMPADELDFELDGEPDAAQASLSPTADHKDFENSISGSMRSINTHDMLDVRQQAEFFMTLGQCEDAIDMLQNSIKQNEDANPLVYLDLLKMLHTLSRKTEYDSIRQDFNRIFTGRVPPYIAFNEPTKGLDSYPELCEKIVAGWPSKPVVDFIEQCLLRGSVNISSGRLDLEAFRDLLMLHSLANQFEASDDAQVESFSALKADMGAMPDFADSLPMMLDMPQEQSVPELMLPPSFEDVSATNVDLDLSDGNNNLIDFDPSIFSLDLPESKP